MAIVATNGKKGAINADIFGSVLTLTFADGNEIVVDVSKLSDDIRAAAIMHGVKQKLVDAAAIARNVDTGTSATVTDKYNAVKKVADRIMSADGKWNEGRGAATTPGASGAILVRALMKMTGKDETYVKDFLSAKTKEERAALKRNPKVLEIMAELQAATVTNGINTDALLGELGVGDESEPLAAMVTPVKETKPNTRTSKKKLVPATAE